jgi:secretion/DNA translocation related TadE-like protein
MTGVRPRWTTRPGVAARPGAAKRNCRTAGERGSASILVLACAGVVALAAAAVVEIGLSVAARHHLATVADASSLAAAAVVDAGPTTACHEATVVARRNGAAVMNCRVVGPVVTVQLSLRLSWPLAWLHPLTLNSRAGPAETNMDHPGQAAAAS